MKFSGRAALVATVFAFGIGSAAHAATLTVATYNIHHGAGMDGVVDLDRLAGVMAGFGADVIALQEVDMTNDRTGRVDQSAVLATALGALTGQTWARIDAPAINYQNGQYGNSILYNLGTLVLDSSRTIALPDPLGDGARSVAEAIFTMADGASFQFMGTHLTHRDIDTPTGTVQTDSLDIIDTHVSDSMPVILAGDMNASATPGEVNHTTIAHALAQGWLVQSPVTGTSTPDGNRVIDYVLSRHADWRVLETWILNTGVAQVASDHYPVVVRFDTAPAPIPLPAGGVLVLTGIAVLAAAGRRRRA